MSLMRIIQRVLGRNAAKYNKYIILLTSDSERYLLIQQCNCMLVNIKTVYIRFIAANVQYRNNHSSVAVLSMFRVTPFRHTFRWTNSFAYRKLSALPFMLTPRLPRTKVIHSRAKETPASNNMWMRRRTLLLLHVEWRKTSSHFMFNTLPSVWSDFCATLFILTR